MNRHFQREARWDDRLPSRAFARVDHVVPPEQGSSAVLWAPDAIDADWLAYVGQIDPRFNLDDPDGVIAAWLKSGSGVRGVRQQQSPFEKALAPSRSRRRQASNVRSARVGNTVRGVRRRRGLALRAPTSLRPRSSGVRVLAQVNWGGCVIEWRIKPPIVVPACGLKQCSTAITWS